MTWGWEWWKFSPHISHGRKDRGWNYKMVEISANSLLSFHHSNGGRRAVKLIAQAELKCFYFHTKTSHNVNITSMNAGSNEVWFPKDFRLMADWLGSLIRSKHQMKLFLWMGHLLDPEWNLWSLIKESSCCNISFWKGTLGLSPPTGLIFFMEHVGI